MNRLRGRLTVIVFTAYIAVLGAQVQAADAPGDTVLGYVFDAARRTSHPVLGTTGEAHVGEALASAVTFAAFVATPARPYGLALDVTSRAALFVELAPTSVSASPISAINDGADRILLSPMGGAAAFYDRKTRSVQIVRGLPEAREATSPIPLNGLDGLITAMALNDAGDSLLVGITGESGGSLYLVAPSRDPRKIIDAGRIVSITFLPGSKDAAVSDHDRNEVVLIRNLAESPAVPVATTVLGGEQAGIIRPASIAGSRDGLAVYAVTGRRRRIARFSVPPAGAVAGGAPSFIDCDCRPDQLIPLAGNAVFGLTAASDSPFYVYDGDREADGRPDPRIVVVPSINPAKLTQPKPVQPPRTRRGRSAR